MALTRDFYAPARTSFGGGGYYPAGYFNSPAVAAPSPASNPYLPTVENSGTFDLATMLDFIVTLPTLKQSKTTLDGVRTWLTQNQLASGAGANELILYIQAFSKQVLGAVGAEFETTDALRKGLLIDILPIMMGGGGGNNQMATMLMMMLLLGDGGLF